MNKQILIPYIAIFVMIVGLGVFFLVKSAIDQKATQSSQMTERQIDTRNTTTQESMTKEQSEAEDETKPTTSSGNKTYEQIMEELETSLDVEATNSESEAKEVENSNTVESDVYLDIYNSNEF